MTNDDLKELEDRVKHQGYEAIDQALRPLGSDDLLILLDSKSRKIGDTAAGLLDSRKETDRLIDALLNNRIRTALGRVRASNVLNWYGRAVPEATAVCVHLLNDRSNDVVDNALFGIVFMRRRDLLPKLREHLALAHGDQRRERYLTEAIKALEANDPSLFSPGFHDAKNVWRLNEPVEERMN
jgi:hypothetical protein